MTRSLPLTLDTSQANVIKKKWSTTSASTTTTTTTITKEATLDRDREADEDESNLINDFGHQRQEDVSTWSIYETRQELLLGVSIAILVFFIVIVFLFVINLRHISRSSNSISNRNSDKQFLVDNEESEPSFDEANCIITENIHV